METEKNIISPEAKLSAIASIMFFSPFIKNNIESENFSEDEKIFIKGYIKIWYFNLTLLVIVLLVALANLFEVNQILTRIINIWSLSIFIISVFSIFACANELGMRWPNESIKQGIQQKWQILKVYTPIMNFILRFRQENYNTPYRWLKESILLRTCFIFGTLLFWNAFWIWVLTIIMVRVVLLMLNIDIIPLSIKKAINSLFSCNPWEICAYFFAPIISWIKKTDYDTTLHARRQLYAQWQNFWIWITLQYILFIWILFLLHRWITISLYNILLLVAMFLRIIRIAFFYKNKKTFLRIPILSEITCLAFN